jgi:hypothetical protein
LKKSENKTKDEIARLEKKLEGIDARIKQILKTQENANQHQLF